MRECDFVEQIFQRFSPKPVKSIPDGGCGTGGHAVLFAERGYIKLTGIDSSPIMLEEASRETEPDLKLDLELMDLREFDIGARFDACLCIFVVMGYLTKTE